VNIPRDDHRDVQHWAEADRAQDRQRAQELRWAATVYRQFYAGEEGRLGRGLEIALNEGVTFHGHQARVRSSSDPEVAYQVQETHCDCPDFGRAPGGRCKHRWAVFLTRVAAARLALADHPVAS
jgi:hypothetical protein